jgi:hypothetical protein
MKRMLLKFGMLRWCKSLEMCESREDIQADTSTATYMHGKPPWDVNPGAKTISGCPRRVHVRCQKAMHEVHGFEVGKRGICRLSSSRLFDRSRFYLAMSSNPFIHYRAPAKRTLITP